MDQRKEKAAERRKFISENMDKPVSWVAGQLGIGLRQVEVIKATLRKGSMSKRDEVALERKKFVAANMDKNNVWLSGKIGISTRAVAHIKAEIRSGKVKLDGMPVKNSTFGKIAFDGWLADSIKKQFARKRPPKSMNTLQKALLKSLPKNLSEFKEDLKKSRISQDFEEIFWKGRDPILREAIRAGYTAEKLHDLLSKQLGDRLVPPKWVIELKHDYMKGLSKAPRETNEGSLPGILRVPIADAPAYTLPKTSFKKPFHALADSDKENLRVALISAPQLGLAYDPDIELNLTRCGFAAARKAKCDAIVISGGLFRIMWQKTAGPNRLLNDLVMGTEIDIESIASTYRDRVIEILRSGSLDPVFTTPKERLTDILRGWYKVVMRPTKTPEFNGPIYVVLSPDELGLVRRMAYFELLYKQTQELSQAEAEKRLWDKLAAEAHMERTTVNHDGTRKEIALAEKAYGIAKEEAQKAAEKVNRIRMSHLDSRQNSRVYKQALSYLLHEIKRNVPGFQVIDQNSAYVVFGKSKHTIKFVSGGDSNNPYYDELGGYGPAQRRRELPALTIVSHSRAVYARKTTRENYLDGSMLGTVGFAEAPMLVDREAILEKAEGNKVSLPVVKAVSDSMFNGGMMIVKIDSTFGVTPEFVNTEAVRRIAAPGGRPALPPSKRLYLMIATDLHFGGSMRVPITRPSGVDMFLTEAVFELLQKWGLKNGIAPVAGMFVCDDINHGNHFGTHMRPHYNVRPYAQVSTEVENGLRNLAKDPALREKQMHEMVRQSVNQIRFRPPDYLTGQFMELFHGLLRPYKNVFKGMLLASKQAGVVVKGVSDFAGTGSDMRDLGLISFGSGNHATKTTDGMLHEGVIVAEVLRSRLLDDPDLAGLNLDRLISSPLYQDQGISYGTLKVGDGYEWGLHVSGTPPKRDSWRDVLHGWVQVNRQRGNPSSILNGRSILHLTGDKHFFAGAFAGNDVYVMGPSSTHTDGFAEIAGGLAENNSGVAFVGLPVEGPDSGEISVVHLTRGIIQKYISSGEPFPWNKLLPDSVLEK